MSQSNIYVPPEFVRLVDERIHLRAEYSNARNDVNQLNQFTGQVPMNAPTQPLALAQAGTTPPLQVAAALPLLQKELVEIQRVENTIKEQYLAIEEIKRKAKSFMMTLIGVGVGVALVLILVLYFVIHH